MILDNDFISNLTFHWKRASESFNFATICRKKIEVEKTTEKQQFCVIGISPYFQKLKKLNFIV